MKRRTPETLPMHRADPFSRRSFLQSAAALALMGCARSEASDSTVVSGVCSSGRSNALYIPRDRGYLGRLELNGEPLTLVATRAPKMPQGIVHGSLAYRARRDGRDYVNPTLIVRQGERVRLRVENRLDEPTIVHWHGLAVDSRNDGSGMFLVDPGQTYGYEFEVPDRGSLYWYHPHPHGQTARQLYGGLYGAIEVDDDDNTALRRALDLAPGRTEFTLVVQDRTLDATYAPTPADFMHGFFGSVPYVNGASCAHLDLASRVYRLRILNACNARTLCLGFRNASGGHVGFSVIGNDGGLLRSPQQAERAFLAAAERLDLLIDLRDAPVGETIVLESVAFDPMHAEIGSATADAQAGMTHDGASIESAHAGHRHGGAWAEGAARDLLTFKVRRRIVYDRRVPATLSTIESIDTANARERPFRLGFNKGRWRINDRVFVMGETPIEVARDSTEVWLLRNYHTSMPHAMHLHGFHFEVLERETSPDFVHALAIDERGRVASDFGRKDTILVWPGESVRVAIRFAMPFPAPQTYVFHCHNVEHEDGGMMLGVKVS